MIVTRYELRDATGELVAIHERHEPENGTKTFTWCKPDGSLGLAGTPVAALPLYGIERLSGSATVIVVEGEKATDALLGIGAQAVGTVTGASATPSALPLAELGGRRVVLWADNDEVGRAHMQRIGGALAGVADSVLWIDWPDAPAHGDAADFIAAGGTSEAVSALVSVARPVRREIVEAAGIKSEPDFGGGRDESLLPPPSEPMKVANRFVAERFTCPGDGLILRHWRGAFWRWHTSHWREVVEQALVAEAYRYTEDAMFLKMTRNGPEIVPWAPNRHRIGDLVDALRAVTHLGERSDMPAWLDDVVHLPARELVACANGLLHVPTRTLLAHDHAYFNGVAVPFEYESNPPRPTRWLAFLDELWHDDPDAIAALAEFFGYVISGRRDLHKILLLIGPTRAGKGVIARILKALVGPGNFAGPTLASLGTNFGLSPLIGKPLAIVSDARLGGANVHQVVERLLSVSGEDALTVDVKFKEPWTGTLPTRFLVISNELPRFGDASGAIANRFVVLTLRQSWLGRENSSLTDELLAELPGILAWVLDGLERLNARGHFTEPSSSRDAILSLADLVSPTSAFVRDRCEVEPASEVPCDALYYAWKAWADDNGHRVGSSSSFGRDLRAVLPSLRTVRPRGDDRQRRYRGVRLHPSHNGPVTGPSWTKRPSDYAGPRSDPVVQDGPARQPSWPGDVELPAAGAARQPESPAAQSARQHDPAELRDWLAAPLPEPDEPTSDEWGTIQ